jgi:hypothetical protein
VWKFVSNMVRREIAREVRIFSFSWGVNRILFLLMLFVLLFDFLEISCKSRLNKAIRIEW